jgi:hypothetical protein
VVHRLSRLVGFHVHATDDAIGHVDDILVDENVGRLCYLVIDTSNWMGGKWVAISPGSVRKVDWVEQVVHVALTREEIKSSPSMEETSVPPHELAPRFVII